MAGYPEHPHGCLVDAFDRDGETDQTISATTNAWITALRNREDPANFQAIAGVTLARISHRARLADKVGNETDFAKSRLIAMARIAA
ncbi:MAG: hypothetical protein ACLQKA_19595 [Bryobacteraceae bacterium]